MYCNKCRREISDGSRYCNYCGADQKSGRSNGKSILVTVVIVVAMYLVGRMIGNVIGGSMTGPSEGSEGPRTTQVEAPQTKPAETEGAYLEYIPASWAAERRQMSDGGQYGVLETDTPVKNCTKLTLVLKAEGNYGATTRGNWEVHFRINGQWKKIQTIYYSGNGEENFTISFDPSASFDAVCAFPTQRGNYSYQYGMALIDAYCA